MSHKVYYLLFRVKETILSYSTFIVTSHQIYGSDLSKKILPHLEEGFSLNRVDERRRLFVQLFGRLFDGVETVERLLHDVDAR